MNLSRCALFLLLLLLSAAAAALDAPAGYSWQEFKPGKIALLKPDGWHVKTESRNGTQALFITQEPIGPGGKFLAGLSLNYVTGIRGKAQVSSTEYARNFLAAAADRHKVLDSFARPLAEGVNGLGMRIRLADGNPALCTISSSPTTTPTVCT